ncbi:MAG TPA: DUF4055 domain-containing protein [Acidocella sp.]|nr:DUF4055 domain-containing protein [Acidocella sp.]
MLVDFDDKKARAYLSCYQAESILSWADDYLVLTETVYEADPADAQAQKAIEQIRQLHIVDGKYTVTIWRKSYNVSTGSEWTIYTESTPAKRGKPFTAIPWVWISTMGQSDKIEKPVLLGLVNISYSHYRTTADLEHGRHFTALPTLYVTGVQNDTAISVGGGAVITLSDPASKAGYAEFTGAGLKSLEMGLEAKQQQMATLGAAIWGARKGIEAAETARMRVAGESSLLMGIVSAVESGLLSALQMAADWMGVVGEIVLRINRDFIDQKIDAQTLVGMVQAYQAGAMSLDSFVYCLQQSEMLPPETEIEDEVKKLNAAQAAKTTAAAKVAAQMANPLVQ